MIASGVVATALVLAAAVAPGDANGQTWPHESSIPAPPGAPASAVGFLRLETDAPDARMAVDGVDLGADPSSGAPVRVLSLRAGVHQVALARPGYAPVVVAVEILPGNTTVVRWPATTAAGAPSAEGYQVIPPRATAPERPAEDSGYFVVPKP